MEICVCPEAMNRNDRNSQGAYCPINWKDYVLKHCKTQEYWHHKLGLKGPSPEPGSTTLRCKRPNCKPSPEKTQNKCHKDEQIIAHVTRLMTKQTHIGCLIKQSFVRTVQYATNDQSKDFHLHIHSD